MRNRKDGGFKTNALGVTITGRPLGGKTDSDVRRIHAGAGRRTVKLSVGLFHLSCDGGTRFNVIPRPPED